MTRAELRAEQADCIARMKQSPDEFHPDPRVAAAFADIKAKRYTISYLEGEVSKLTERLKGKPYNASTLKDTRAKHQAQLSQAKAEMKELEEVAARWIPQTES